MKKIVLTGATGFIGSTVLKKLLADGHQAIVLLRHESKMDRIIGVTGYESVHYQTLTQEGLAETLATYKPDAFIHLGWKGVGGSDRNQPFQVTENLSATIHSVELAHKAGCEHWIGIGSQAEYGNPNRKVSENAPALPTTLYGKAKLAACWAGTGLCEELVMKASWIRVFSTYGVGDEPTWFIPYIITELKKGNVPKLTNCEQLWDYLYVEDAANAILSVVYQRASGIFNIGSGQAVSLKSVVELIRKSVASDAVIDYGAVPYRPDQVMHLEADTSRIRQATGWTPSVTLKDGIERMISHYS